MPRFPVVALCCLVGVLVIGSRAAPGQTTPPTQVVRHVVVFKYTPEATTAQIQVITDAFRALTTTIPGIVAFEHGVNNSPEKLNQGFTHVFQVTFANAAARDAYLPHPAHKAFGSLLGSLGILDGVFVVDYAPTR